VQRVVCDNPFKDGPGIAANVFLGDGRPILRFEGEVVLVFDEASCDVACDELRKHAVLGFDTENVAYIPPYVGTNVDAAAIVQLCGDETYCVIFVVHAWGGKCFESFKSLMHDQRILKVANNVAHDVSMITKRFPDVLPAGGSELSDKVKALVSLLDYKLETMVARILGKHIDKRIQHQFWEAQKLLPRQIAYAATDALAHLELYRRVADPTATSETLMIDQRPESLALDAFTKSAESGTESTTACTRRRRNHSAAAADDDDDDDGGGGGVRDVLPSGCDDDDDDDEEEPEEAEKPSAPEKDDAASSLTSPAVRADAAAKTILDMSKSMIDDFYVYDRQEDLVLPTSLSSDDRKLLHRYADNFSLYHRSHGPASETPPSGSAFLALSWNASSRSATTGKSAFGDTSPASKKTVAFGL